MSKFKLKIYLKDSDKAHLADKRVRIIRDGNPLRPDKNEDLVFEVTMDQNSIPSNVLKTWKLDRCNLIFFTTAERCKEMVSKDPSYWTSEKLDELANIEKRIWEDWYDGYVYGYIVEHWDKNQRKWIADESLYGMYGADELIFNILENLDNDILVCMDDDVMKYEFDNAEMSLNQF